ncbi:MAG: C4-dicarboxylic acid transporter DauA [Desulfobulbaceae bacterium]|nr:C4-dicarboxylic acid transporter DauA [Desulfobulbaceae bacterium]
MNTQSSATNPLFATAIRSLKQQQYGISDLRGDILAGITVGIVAIPLAMALAIASGVPPQHGLYTSIIAGALIALTGGSRVNISGPTAAFIVILLPITQHYGIGGLLIATVMAGCILVGMGIAKMGKLIQYIPYPVTTGFTSGIAVVIAVLQLKDFFGLPISALPNHFPAKIKLLAITMPSLHWPDMAVGLITLTALVLWPRLKIKFPGHLVALLLGTMAAIIGSHTIDGFSVATIGSRFSYSMDGISGTGIPSLPPLFALPWTFPDSTGQPVGINFNLVRELIPSAAAIAILGAIESLLCAVVADGLSGDNHDPNGELIGQGLGNIVAPFFGGITATAAIARTATNIRANGRTPIAAIVHAGTVLAGVMLLAPYLSYLPMAALAAVLLIVARDMSEAKHFVHILRAAPRSDVAVLMVCFGLTVVFDMVLAVSAGVVLASFLFIHRMTELSDAIELDHSAHQQLMEVPNHIAVYEIKGPLFFGAAGKALGLVKRFTPEVEGIVINMTNVTTIDITGIVALQSLINTLNADGVAVVLCSLNDRICRKILRGGIRKKAGLLGFTSDLDRATRKILRMRPGNKTPLRKDNEPVQGCPTPPYLSR